MSFVTIARRELEERRIILIGAVASALIPVLLAMIPLAGTPSERFVATGQVVSIGFTMVVALALGVSLIGRDLSTGRLSFYFERPVSAAAIWFGKLAAAALLVVAAFSITYVPVWLVQGPSDGDLSGVVIAALALLLIAHAISTMTRSHSWLIGVDLFAAAAALVACFCVLAPLARAGAGDLAMRIAITVVAGALLAVVVAGLWQLKRGRADRRDSHAAFSTALWGSIATLLLLAGVVVAWTVTRGPQSMWLRLDMPLTAKRPELVVLTGRVRNAFLNAYDARFLVNTRTGRWRRLPDSMSLDISADGSTMIWIEYGDRWWGLGKQWSLRDHEVELYVAETNDLAGRRLVARFPSYVEAEVNSNGDAVVTLSRLGLIAIYETRSGKLRAASRMPARDGQVLRLLQLRTGVILVKKSTSRSGIEGFTVVEIRGIDAKSAVLSQPVTARYAGVGVTVLPSRDGSRVDVMNERWPAGQQAPPTYEWSSIDPVSGSVDTVDRVERPGRTRDGRFRLQDGRIVEMDSKASGRLLINGQPIAHLPFSGWPVIVAEVAPATVVVASRWRDGGFEGLETIDLNRGRTIQSATDLLGEVSLDPVTQTLLVTDRTGHLIRWNPLTGERTPFIWK